MQLHKAFLNHLLLAPKNSVCLRYGQVRLLSKYPLAFNLKPESKSYSAINYKFAGFFSSMNPNGEDPDQKGISAVDKTTDIVKAPAESAVSTEKTTNPSDDTNNPPKPKAPKKPQKSPVFNHILMRIMKTCIIYLDSSPEQKSSVGEDSRFSYVKKVLDPMTPEEQGQFRAYLNEFKTRRALNNYVLSTISLKIFLNEEKNGPIFRSLYVDFLADDNRDRLWDLNPLEDEVSIGQIQAVSKRPRKNLLRALTEYLKMFQEILPFGGTEFSQTELPTVLRAPSNIYGFILSRIIKTCQIYLDSLPEQRSLVGAGSRFYYVKKRIDSLSPEEQEDFKGFLAHSKSLSHNNSTLYKADVKKLFKEGKNGDIMRSLYFDFIEHDNRDRLLLTRLNEDEVAIGTIHQEQKSFRDNVIISLTEDLKKLQYLSEDLKETAAEEEEQQTASSQNEAKRNGLIYFLPYVFTRVTKTCETYLNALPEKRNSVDVDSRFYYVKQSVDNLSFEEEEAFRMYVRRALDLKSSIHQDKVRRLKNQSEASGNTEVPSDNSDTQTIQNVDQRKIIPFLSVKNIRDFLKEDKNGPILENLLYEFMKDDNRDLFWAINSQEDEVAIGKVEKVKKRIGKHAFYSLTTGLKLSQRMIRKLQFK